MASTPAMPASAVPISPSSNNGNAPHGASATSRGGSNNGDSTTQHQGNTNATGNVAGTPNRLSRGNSFRIPLPPNSPSTGHAALSPSSPGNGGSGAIHSQLGTSYGSSNSNSNSTGSRLGNFALGFRRNRGASTNRGEITSPVTFGGNNPPSPPASAFPSLQASTSLTDFGGVAGSSPYFDASGNNDAAAAAQQHAGTGAQATSPGHNASNSITGRGYFTRRGFGRKNTGGLLSGGRTPTSEQPPSTSTGAGAASSAAGGSVLNRSRSSSQPSLPLSVSSNTIHAQTQQQQGGGNAPTSANAATMTFSGTSQPVMSNLSQTGLNATAAGAGGGTSSNDSSRRASGEASRAPTTATTANAAAAPTSSSMMQQRTTSQAANTGTAPNSAPVPSTSTSASASASTSSETHHIRLVPHLESTRSLHFDPVSRDIQPTIPLRIGRFTDRNPNQPISSLDQNRIAFKSKVVSRTHAEIWYDPNPTTANSGTGTGTSGGSGGWFIRDLKSSSGTFLNHIRLSGAGMESRPFPIRDGDVLQLGVDYQGGTEEIYRCVKMRIELNRGWQRGANSFNTNALRQIRALGNVSDQAAPTSTDGSKKNKKKSKKRKSKKNKDSKEGESGMATDDVGKDDDATGSDGMQVDKKTKEKKKESENTTSPSGVTDCCICLFSVTVYQALFIAPCSHIFHFKCIRPLLMQHHPGFSCPLCRTFGDLEADVEQDDLPEPVAEESSSSSSSGESESEEEGEEEGSNAAPALPDKDLPPNATVNTVSASENTAVHNVAPASDPNMDTLRPGRKSPLIPSVSEFGSTSTSQGAAPAASTSAARASPRPSLDVVRPASPRVASGTRTPPSRGSRVASMHSVPPSGAAVAAALESHVTTTPHQQHHSHHHHSSHHHSGNAGEAAFSPPSAGDFDPDIRRGSIYVHGADGHAMHIPITGRSRPGSVHEAELSSDIHHHHHHHNHQSPSVSAAEKSKARSVKSIRMTKSKNSTGSLRNAAASSPSYAGAGGPSTSSGHRRRLSAPSSSDEDDTSPMDIEAPLTARPMPGAVSAPGQYPFPDAIVDSTTPTMPSASGMMDDQPQAPHSEDVDMEDGQDTTPPMSNREDEDGVDAPASKGKGRDTRSASSSTRRDHPQTRQGGMDGNKQQREEASASVHAIV